MSKKVLWVAPYKFRLFDGLIEQIEQLMKSEIEVSQSPEIACDDFFRKEINAIVTTDFIIEKLNLTDTLTRLFISTGVPIYVAQTTYDEGIMKFAYWTKFEVKVRFNRLTEEMLPLFKNETDYRVDVTWLAPSNFPVTEFVENSMNYIVGAKYMDISQSMRDIYVKYLFTTDFIIKEEKLYNKILYRLLGGADVIVALSEEPYEKESGFDHWAKAELDIVYKPIVAQPLLLVGGECCECDCDDEDDTDITEAEIDKESEKVINSLITVFSNLFGNNK